MNNIVFFALFLCSVYVYGGKLPDDFKVCKRSDPNYNQCIIVAAQAALKTLENGNKAIGFPSLAPLRVAEMQGTSTGSFKVTETYKNLDVYGLINVKIETANFDLDNYIFEFVSFSPAINLQGDYSLKGKFSVLDINGHGRCNTTIEDFKIRHKLTCKKFEQGSKEYLRIENYTTIFENYNLHVDYKNMVPGNEQLSNELNAVFQENANTIYDEAKVWHQVSYAKLFQGLANIVFTRVPFDEIFPA